MTRSRCFCSQNLPNLGRGLFLVIGRHESLACERRDALERVHHRGDDDGRVALAARVV